jgi:branched-chain amino acid transport system permease protein
LLLLQLLANGIINGCLFALLAVGFALIYNTTRVFHIAYGATYTVAAYLCYFFLVRMQWTIPAAIGGTVLLTSLLGVLIQVFVYAPLERKRASLLVALLSSLGLDVVLVNLIPMFFGNETRVLRPGAEPVLTVGPVFLSGIQLAVLVTAALLLSLVLLLLRYSRLGSMVRAVRDDPILAVVMGIDQGQVRLAVFAAGSALAGMASILTALDVGVEPNVGMPALLVAAVALIIGGVGSFGGAVVGGFFLGVLQSLIVWRVSTRWTDTITFTLLILFLLFRPQGLLGTRHRLEEGTG